MIALELTRFVKAPIPLEVAAGAERPQPQHRFSTLETPASARDVHSVANQMTAGSLDDPAGDWESGAKVGVVVQVRLVPQQIPHAGIGRLALGAVHATTGSAACDPPGH